MLATYKTAPTNPCALVVLTVITLLCLRGAHAQALPTLPEVSVASPSPSTSTSPSPSPSLRPSPSPRPLPAPRPSTSSGPGSVPNPIFNESNIGRPQQTTTPTPAVNTPLPALLPPTFPIEDSPAESCTRNINNPAPILGASAKRVALSVVATAAAVGVISVIYSLAADWQPHVAHTSFRLVLIVLARILTIAAVRISAALVVSITAAAPGDAVFDASGAYLTWVSAISTRVYYEAIRMTTAAAEFGGRGGAAWDVRLRDFINGRTLYKEVDTHNTKEIQVKIGTFGTDAPDTTSVAARRETGTTGEVSLPILTKSRSRQPLARDHLPKTLLVLTSVFYIAHEITNLLSSLLNFINSLSDGGQVSSIFVADAEGGQCGIRGRDMRIILPLALLQFTFTLCQQPSLVPILILGVFRVPRELSSARERFPHKRRWFAYAILLLWVGSLATLPLFVRSLEPFYVVGDLSLFWYVILAPPTYRSATYSVSVVYACFATLSYMVITSLAKHAKTS